WIFALRLEGFFILRSSNIRPRGLSGYASLSPGCHNGVAADAQERSHQDQAAPLLDAVDQLRALTGRLQSVREEERSRIAREIHDELGQALTALKMDLAWLRGRLARGS